MKHFPSSTRLYEKLESVRVYLDDLEGLVAEMRNAGLRVTIRSGSIEFDSLEELRQVQGVRPSSLSLIAELRDKAWDRIEIDLSGSDIAFSASDTDALGPIAFRVRDKLRGTQLHSTLLLPSLWWTLGFSISMGALLATHPSVRTWGINLGLGSYTLALATWIARRGLWGVRLRRRHEGGFWKRNADSVLLLLLGAVLGSVITAAVDWIRAQ